jgi:hypothetical protein
MQMKPSQNQSYSNTNRDYVYTDSAFIIDIKICEENEWVVRLNQSRFQFKLLTTKKSSPVTRRSSTSHQLEIISVDSLKGYFDQFTLLPAIHTFELQLGSLSNEFPMSVFKESRTQAIYSYLKSEELEKDYSNFTKKIVETNAESKAQTKGPLNYYTNDNTNKRNNFTKKVSQTIDEIKSKVSSKKSAAEIVAMLKELECQIKQERLLALEEQYNI